MTTLRDLISAKFDVESMDDLPEEVVHDTLEGIEGTMADKIDAIAGLLTRWSQHEDAIQAEVNRLQSRKKMFQRRREQLKQYLTFQMGRLNQAKIETDLHTVFMRKGSQRVVIDDEGALPSECLNVVTTPNKNLIKYKLSEEQDVPGAHLERGPDTVVIK